MILLRVLTHASLNSIVKAGLIYNSLMTTYLRCLRQVLQLEALAPLRNDLFELLHGTVVVMGGEIS